MTVLFETPSTPSAKPRKAPTAPDGTLHPTANKWSRTAAEALFALPFMDLLLKAQTIHREHHAPNEVQLSQLISIKTGGCAEDCGYCNQSAHFDTGLKASKLMDIDTVINGAKAAKAGGASRFCMGAALSLIHI